MSEQGSSEVLSNLLNQLRYSLLQYIGESWPWTDSEAQGRRDTFTGLVRRQQFGAERLASLLSQRRAVVPGSNYPHDSSHLHYVTIDYARTKLIENSEGIVTALREAATVLATDDEALRLVEQLTADEVQTTEALRNL